MSKDPFETTLLENIIGSSAIGLSKLNDFIEKKTGFDFVGKSIKLNDKLEEKDAKFKEEHPVLNVGKHVAKATAKGIFGSFHHH